MYTNLAVLTEFGQPINHKYLGNTNYERVKRR